MHCFICFISTVALLTVTSAAGIRPILSISRTDDHPLPLRRGYQEQDTARAFYSYGYSDENAARAEYTTLDGSSRGFYSYVDANGKLQTVKYEAGGSQGFKAEASNQPKAPVDDQKAPLPVTDTLEVQQARQAHLNALREAQEETRQKETRREETQQQQDQEKTTKERTLSDEDADILERVRAELTSMLAERQREESRLDEEESRKEDDAQNEENVQSQDDELQQQEQRQEERQPGRDQRLQTANDAKDLRLRTVYTLADINSSSYLKLSDLQDRLDRNNQELRVPIGAYYSYVSPNAKYSVTTPTELRTLRPVALSRSLLLSKQNQN